MWKFQRKRKPKQLTLRQVHELYLVLKHALPKEDEEFLIEQVQYILKRAAPGTLLSSLKIMYKSLPKDLNAIEATSMFIEGLKENSFFAYTDFLKGLRGR